MWYNYFSSKGITAEKKDCDKSFDVNVTGYAIVLQSCYEPMKNIKGPNCKTTKGATAIMTKCMALDLSDENIRVNSVSPGWVWSPEVSKPAGEKWYTL